MKNKEINKHTTFEYLKLIFKTDKRYLYVLLIEVIASLFWSLAPLGLTNYILRIYNETPKFDSYFLVLIVCAVYTIFRVLVSYITMFIYSEYVQRIYRRFNNEITSKILKKVLDVDLETYQSTSFLDNYQKVIDNVTDNMVGTFWDVNSLIGSLVSLAGISTILSIINPIILI